MIHVPGIDFLPATKRHARELARAMRHEDRQEILLSGGFTDPERCLRASLNRSLESWAVYSGELLCVFGVMQDRAGWFLPWALTSDAVGRHPLAYWRGSKVVVDYLRGRYPQMVQMVHARYGAAVRWVERLGFKVEPAQPFGTRGGMFHRISMVTREVVCVSR